MHLRMTGNLLLSSPESDDRFLRAVLRLDDGAELWFTDPRRFGHGEVIAGADLDAYFASRLGVEPLSGEPDPEVLWGTCRRAHRAAEVVPAGPGPRCRRRQHLRGRGAVSRRLHPLSPAGSMKPEHWRTSARGSSKPLRPDSRTVAPRSTTTATRAANGDRCRMSSSCTRARARSACAAARSSPHRRWRALDLLLPGVPGAPAAKARRRRSRAKRLSSGRSAPAGFGVGHWTDSVGLTGCTVVTAPPADSGWGGRPRRRPGHA